MTNLSYQDALDFLYSFIDYGSERSDRYSPDVFELARMKRVLAQMGDPQWRYPAIHIAGTKGKGSVAALIASTLQQAGFRTGLYTSPHLVDFTERIQINRREIGKEEVAAGVTNLQTLAEFEPDITTYELMTALAFQYFAEQQIDVGVFEVGLGGRLDSTNVVQPLVCVITSLSFDHTHLLGDTLTEIAAEKGGIIKQGVPVISAPQSEEAERVLQQIARDRKAPIEFIGQDWHAELDERSLKSQRFRVWKNDQGPDGEDSSTLEIPLLGEHQLENAVVAYAALKKAEQLRFSIPQSAYKKGFAEVQWHGRFQILRRQPALVVDSAHNGYSAEKLKAALAAYFPGRPVHLIFGASEDKDIQSMLAALGPIVSRATMTQAVHPRAANPDQLIELARPHIARLDRAVPVQKALQSALAMADRDDVIVATGSLFIVGEVLSVWNNTTSQTTLPAVGEIS